MAAPSYTEDLTDIDLAEAISTGWTAFNISGGGGGAPAFGADLGIQGDGCWDKPASNAERGLAVNKTPGAGTVAAGVHIFVWGFCATPGITDTLALRGAYVIIGTSTTDFMQFHVEGSDTYGAAGRVARCYPVSYVTTSNTGSVPYRTVNGSPGATPTYFGFGIKTTATAKGSNIGCDAIRYGTGGFLTAGELISAGDASDNPCTFSGFNLQNDDRSLRWGIFTKVGTSFELQGKFAMGQNNAGTATLCRFKDSDKAIIIPDTVHSATDFSQIIVDHPSTRVEWTNINIEALGTNNKGLINVINSSSVFTVVGGTFTNIGSTTLRGGCDFTGATWRGSESVSLNGATVDSCIFDKIVSSSSVITSDLVNVNGCSFISDGSNHAVELTSLGSGTMTWNNTSSGYVSGSSGSPATTSSTGNEALYVNVGSGTLTVNVADGATIPSIRTAGATVNVVAGLKTFTFSTLPSFTGYEWRIYEVTSLGSLSGSVEIAGEESSTNSSNSYSYSYSSDQTIAVQIISQPGADYREEIRYYTLTNNDQSVTINLEVDNNN